MLPYPDKAIPKLRGEQKSILRSTSCSYTLSYSYRYTRCRYRYKWDWYRDTCGISFQSSRESSDGKNWAQSVLNLYEKRQQLFSAFSNFHFPISGSVAGEAYKIVENDSGRHAHAPARAWSKKQSSKNVWKTTRSTFPGLFSCGNFSKINCRRQSEVGKRLRFSCSMKIKSKICRGVILAGNRSRSRQYELKQAKSTKIEPNQAILS